MKSIAKNPWRINRADPYDYNSAQARAWQKGWLAGYGDALTEIRRRMKAKKKKI